jgi:hypothetical protein
MVTPINSAISLLRWPRSTRFLICSMCSGVNLWRRGIFLHSVLRSAAPVAPLKRPDARFRRFHFFVASAPVRVLLLCAKHLFVAAMVAIAAAESVTAWWRRREPTELH